MEIFPALLQGCFLSATRVLFPQRYQSDVSSAAIQDILLVFQTRIQVTRLKNRFRYFVTLVGLIASEETDG